MGGSHGASPGLLRDQPRLLCRRTTCLLRCPGLSLGGLSDGTFPLCCDLGCLGCAPLLQLALLQGGFGGSLCCLALFLDASALFLGPSALFADASALLFGAAALFVPAAPRFVLDLPLAPLRVGHALVLGFLQHPHGSLCLGLLLTTCFLHELRVLPHKLRLLCLRRS